MAELADAPDLGSGVFDVKVQVLSGAPHFYNSSFHGALAQLGAHDTGSVGVRGSSPLCSTRGEPSEHFVYDTGMFRFELLAQMKKAPNRPYSARCFTFTSYSTFHDTA